MSRDALQKTAAKKTRSAFLLTGKTGENFPPDGLHDPVTRYGINYTGTQVTQWDFQNKGTRTSPARLSFVLEVPLRNLRLSVIYSVPCDRIVQRTYFSPKKSGTETAVPFDNVYFLSWENIKEPARVLQ